MALNGLKLNLRYFLLHSLHKMVFMVQRTLGNQDRSLFHHGMIKMLVLYQLDTIEKTWDEFLKENEFEFTQFWPTYLPKTHAKRRRPCEREIKEEIDLVDDHEGLDKLCLIAENEKFYTSTLLNNPREKTKWEKELKWLSRCTLLNKQVMCILR